jgi:GNAT superfamily N-acetyltransferase
VDDLDVKIDRAVAFYRQRGLTPAFRVSPFARPATLAARLAERGFSAGEETAVETADVQDVLAAGAPPHDVRRDASPSAGWLDVFLSASAEPESLQRLRLETLRRASHSAFYSVMVDGSIASVGVGAVDDSGWAGMHGMRSAPHARRLGCARAIVHAAARSAQAQKADRLYLQVEVGNIPARALYRAFGFSQAYSYAYWRL